MALLLSAGSLAPLRVSWLWVASARLTQVFSTFFSHLVNRLKGIFLWQWQDPRKNKLNCAGGQVGVHSALQTSACSHVCRHPIGQSEAHGEPRDKVQGTYKSIGRKEATDAIALLQGPSVHRHCSGWSLCYSEPAFRAWSTVEKTSKKLKYKNI